MTDVRSLVTSWRKPVDPYEPGSVWEVTRSNYPWVVDSPDTRAHLHPGDLVYVVKSLGFKRLDMRIDNVWVTGDFACLALNDHFGVVTLTGLQAFARRLA